MRLDLRRRSVLGRGGGSIAPGFFLAGMAKVVAELSGRTVFKDLLGKLPEMIVQGTKE